MARNGAYGSESEVFNSFLKNNGLSLTRQRNSILSAVFHNHDHFEADEIVDELKKENRRVSRATVYRTLGHLEQCNLIRKIDLGQGRAHFEHILGHQHHEHLFCERCGAVVEFADQVLETRIRKTAAEHGFTMTNHVVRISGLCAVCKGTDSDA